MFVCLFVFACFCVRLSVFFVCVHVSLCMCVCFCVCVFLCLFECFNVGVCVCG